MTKKPTKPSFWGKLVTELQEEHGISERELSRVTDLNRSTLRKLKRGESQTTRVSNIEKLLDFFGYELRALPIDEEATPCLSGHRVSANAAVSLLLGSNAHAKPKVTGNASAATT